MTVVYKLIPDLGQDGGLESARVEFAEFYSEEPLDVKPVSTAELAERYGYDVPRFTAFVRIKRFYQASWWGEPTKRLTISGVDHG